MDPCRYRARHQGDWAAPIAHGYLVLSLIPFLAKNIISYTGVGARHQLRLQQSALHQHGAGGSRIRMRAKCSRANRAAAASR